MFCSFFITPVLSNITLNKRMRIITGQYKGRHFDIPRTFKARPTTDFAKENIFNVLQGYIDFDDAVALDLFAGTGSISLELVSRGCSRVVSVEADRDHANFIRQCFKKLGDESDLLIRGDVFFIVSAVLMFANTYNIFGLDHLSYVQYVHNKWVATVLIAAVLQLYSSHRLGKELSEETKKS